MTEDEATSIANTLLLQIQRLNADNNRLREALEDSLATMDGDEHCYEAARDIRAKLGWPEEE